MTKVSVWEKPSELKTPAELEMEKTQWSEFESGGRPYWVHKETKETTWQVPAEIAGECLAVSRGGNVRAGELTRVLRVAEILARAR